MFSIGNAIGTITQDILKAARDASFKAWSDAGITTYSNSVVDSTGASISPNVVVYMCKFTGGNLVFTGRYNSDYATITVGSSMFTTTSPSSGVTAYVTTSRLAFRTTYTLGISIRFNSSGVINEIEIDWFTVPPAKLGGIDVPSIITKTGAKVSGTIYPDSIQWDPSNGSNTSSTTTTNTTNTSNSSNTTNTDGIGSKSKVGIWIAIFVGIMLLVLLIGIVLFFVFTRKTPIPDTPLGD